MSQLFNAISSAGGSGNVSQLGGFSIDEIIKRFIKDADDAKAANLAQLDQLMTTIKSLGIQVGGTFDEALGSIARAGEAASGEAVRRGQQSLAAGRQELISSGLSNTTLGPNLRRAIDADVARQQQAISEGVGAQRADLLTRRAGQETQIGSLLAQAIQGVNNIGPDLGQFAALIQAASAAGDTNKKVTARIGPGSVGGEGLIRAPSGSRRTTSGGGGGGGSAPTAGGGGDGGGGGSGGDRILRNPGSTNRGSGAATGSTFGAAGQQLNPPRNSFAGLGRQDIIAQMLANQGIA